MLFVRRTVLLQDQPQNEPSTIESSGVKTEVLAWFTYTRVGDFRGWDGLKGGIPAGISGQTCFTKSVFER